VSISADLRRALDPVEFAKWLGFEPDPWQAAVLRGNAQRTLLNCHRQSGKSTTAGILALHTAIYHDNSLILLISPSQRQSGELFRTMTTWLNQAPARPPMVEDNKLSCTFANGSRIVSLPGNEATVRGFAGVRLIVEDEAARVPDDLYFALRPMLAVSGGRLILMSTPFGKRGHFFEEWTNGGDAWRRAEVPATMTPRITAAFLEEERAALGDMWYLQEYCCEFLETTNQIFSYDLVMGAISPDIAPLFGVTP
jgi:hypothetical protein